VYLVDTLALISINCYPMIIMCPLVLEFLVSRANFLLKLYFFIAFLPVIAPTLYDLRVRVDEESQVWLH
jgi:hypothetical protein